MNTFTFVRIPRWMMQDFSDGKLTFREFAILNILWHWANHRTGGGEVNAPTLLFRIGHDKEFGRSWDGAMQAAWRILRSLHTKGYIWYRGKRGPKVVQPYWLHGYPLGTKDSCRSINLTNLLDKETLTQDDIHRSVGLAHNSVGHSEETMSVSRPSEPVDTSTVKHDHTSTVVGLFDGLLNGQMTDKNKNTRLQEQKKKDNPSAVTHGNDASKRRTEMTHTNDASKRRTEMTHTNDASKRRTTEETRVTNVQGVTQVTQCVTHDMTRTMTQAVTHPVTHVPEPSLDELRSYYEYLSTHGGVSESEFKALGRKIAEMEAR